MGIVIQIIIWSVKVAIPTVIFLLGLNLLIVSKGKWEERLGNFFGVNDMEISQVSFIVLKVVASLMVIASLALAYFLFIPQE